MDFCNALSPSPKEVSAATSRAKLGNLVPVKLKVYAREMAALVGVRVPEWIGSETQVNIINSVQVT